MLFVAIKWTESYENPINSLAKKKNDVVGNLSASNFFFKPYSFFVKMLKKSSSWLSSALTLKKSVNDDESKRRQN